MLRPALKKFVGGFIGQKTVMSREEIFFLAKDKCHEAGKTFLAKVDNNFVVFVLILKGNYILQSPVIYFILSNLQ
jgi:hypothetical protein